MKCNHENADHLKPGEWFNLAEVPQYVVQVEQLRCLDCGAFLSLGPSNDDGVEHEICAAEIAALGQLAFKSLEHPGGEWFGWSQHVAAADYDEYATTVRPHEETGYLAREIVMHGESPR